MQPDTQSTSDSASDETGNLDVESPFRWDLGFNGGKSWKEVLGQFAPAFNPHLGTFARSQGDEVFFKWDTCFNGDQSWKSTYEQIDPKLRPLAKIFIATTCNWQASTPALRSLYEQERHFKFILNDMRELLLDFTSTLYHKNDALAEAIQDNTILAFEDAGSLQMTDDDTSSHMSFYTHSSTMSDMDSSGWNFPSGYVWSEEPPMFSSAGSVSSSDHSSTSSQGASRRCKLPNISSLHLHLLQKSSKKLKSISIGSTIQSIPRNGLQSGENQVSVSEVRTPGEETHKEEQLTGGSAEIQSPSSPETFFSNATLPPSGISSTQRLDHQSRYCIRQISHGKDSQGQYMVDDMLNPTKSELLTIYRNTNKIRTIVETSTRSLLDMKYLELSVPLLVEGILPTVTQAFLDSQCSKFSFRNRKSLVITLPNQFELHYYDYGIPPALYITTAMTHFYSEFINLPQIELHSIHESFGNTMLDEMYNAEMATSTPHLHVSPDSREMEFEDFSQQRLTLSPPILPLTSSTRNLELFGLEAVNEPSYNELVDHILSFTQEENTEEAPAPTHLMDDNQRTFNPLPDVAPPSSNKSLDLRMVLTPVSEENLLMEITDLQNIERNPHIVPGSIGIVAMNKSHSLDFDVLARLQEMRVSIQFQNQAADLSSYFVFYMTRGNEASYNNNHTPISTTDTASPTKVPKDQTPNLVLSTNNRDTHHRDLAPSPIQPVPVPRIPAAQRERTNPYTCRHCSRTFIWPRDLRRHTSSGACSRLAFTPRQHRCTQCGKSFGRRDSLLRHCRVVEHSDNDQRNNHEPPVHPNMEPSRQHPSTPSPSPHAGESNPRVDEWAWMLNTDLNTNNQNQVERNSRLDVRVGSAETNTIIPIDNQLPTETTDPSGQTATWQTVASAWYSSEIHAENFWHTETAEAIFSLRGEMGEKSDHTASSRTG